jgi:protein-arginine kinase activator protein McsA
MKCTTCGEKAEGMIIMLSMSTMKPSYICSKCQARESNSRQNSVEELDQRIKEFEELSLKYEKLIEQMPEMPSIPKGLESFAMTPLTQYKGIQYQLAEAKARRLELLTEKDSATRLEYELKKSLEEEDYERSALIRDALKANQEKISTKSEETSEEKPKRKRKTAKSKE